jgi:hypothetical protein
MKVALALVCVGAAAGGAWWVLRPEPPPAEPEVAEATEADPSREQTEDLMREIGYVQ